MIGWLRNIMTRDQKIDPAEGLRRWEAAKTNRLNSKQWAYANVDQSINRDLSGELTTLRCRSTYEARNNPWVEGMIGTYVTDVVGPNGPTLQCNSSDSAYNDAFERAFNRWAESPDMTGTLSLVDLLELWTRAPFTDGEYLFQITADLNAPGPIKTRVQDIAPRRLKNPIGVQDSYITLGVERDRVGRPTQYHIEDADDNETSTAMPVTRTIPASEIVHDFDRIDAGQVRGVPMLSPCIQTVSDLRECDAQILDAVRQAADNAVILHTDHNDAEYIEVNETTEIVRRTISTAPPGWKPFQLKPEQPSTTFGEYHDEKLAEIGRVVHMPLMMVKLDSSGHNYSSARFDGQLYQRGICRRQGRLERVALRPLARVLAIELQRRASGPLSTPDIAALARIPADVSYSWTWPQPPHVDPSKEAKTDETDLKTGAKSLTRILASRGTDLETAVATEKREREVYAAAGLEHPLDRIARSAAPAAPPDPVEDDDDEEDDEKDDTPTGSRRGRRIASRGQRGRLNGNGYANGVHHG